MAHYALLDGNNVVVSVIAGKDEGSTDWEAYYGAKAGKVCKRTSYNTRAGVHVAGGTPYRKNYAGRGYTYDAARDAFIPPQPFPSWALDEASCTWAPPVPRPQGFARWDETQQAWLQS